jgi:hypothetical protein
MRLFFILLLILCVQVQGAGKYYLKCRRDLLLLSREICIAQSGTLEEGKNRGKAVESYLASVGLRAGNPYCAAGQYWCFAEACRRLRLNRKFIPLPRTALANAMYVYAERHGKRAKFIPEVDDLIVWRRGASVFGHIERIIAREKAGWVRTVGFNTVKYLKGRKYEGVFIHRRNVYHFLGRLRVRGLIGFKKGAKK